MFESIALPIKFPILNICNYKSLVIFICYIYLSLYMFLYVQCFPPIPSFLCSYRHKNCQVQCIKFQWGGVNNLTLFLEGKDELTIQFWSYKIDNGHILTCVSGANMKKFNVDRPSFTNCGCRGQNLESTFVLSLLVMSIDVFYVYCIQSLANVYIDLVLF